MTSAQSNVALVGFQGRGLADGVQPGLCHPLFLEALIFQSLGSDSSKLASAFAAVLLSLA